VASIDSCCSVLSYRLFRSSNLEGYHYPFDGLVLNIFVFLSALIRIRVLLIYRGNSHVGRKGVLAKQGVLDFILHLDLIVVQLCDQFLFFFFLSCPNLLNQLLASLLLDT